ncbi:unnamed protein product [Rhizophagus irregularis]|uniref:Uncharacterized protein n=1 Tax=Rhizophagus irregularis TaxID=588596 RepID=A0A916E7F8_9GLOM|nr:unnamed protein product [Rhizophagus irregularis]
MEMEKDFSSGDDNEYEDLEEDPIGNDDEYEDLEKNLVDFEEIFSKYKNLEKDLESVIEESSIQSELNNGEPLFEIDRDALANAKKFAQQNVSDEDEDEFSETESDEETSSDKLVWQKKVLAQLVPILCTINQEKSNITSELSSSESFSSISVPSLFIILVIFALVKFDYNTHKKLNPKNLTPKHFFKFGECNFMMVF